MPLPLQKQASFRLSADALYSRLPGPAGITGPVVFVLILYYSLTAGRKRKCGRIAPGKIPCADLHKHFSCMPGA